MNETTSDNDGNFPIAYVLFVFVFMVFSCTLSSIGYSDFVHKIEQQKASKRLNPP